METVATPKTMADPIHLLLRSARDIVPIMVCMLTGMLIDQFIPALAFGVIAVKFYRRFRDNRPDGNTHVALGFSAYLRRIRDLEPFHPDHHSGLAGGVRDYLAGCMVNISIIKFDDG